MYKYIVFFGVCCISVLGSVSQFNQDVGNNQEVDNNQEIRTFSELESELVNLETIFGDGYLRLKRARIEIQLLTTRRQLRDLDRLAARTTMSNETYGTRYKKIYSEVQKLESEFRDISKLVDVEGDEQRGAER